MRLFYTLAAIASVALMSNAAQVTDVISATTVELPEAYAEQEVTLNSDAVYLVTLKDDGNGPQFKAGSSGIATKVSGGTIARVEVAWGSKSNENIEIYGQHTPYAASNGVITGTLLGTIEFSAGATVSLDIDPGEWEYVGVTTTAIKGKAAQFGSISFTWVTPEDTPEEACNGIVLSEVCGDDGTKDGHEDWIELYNPTDKVLDLSGVELIKIDEDGISETLCTIAEGTIVEPGAFYVVEKGIHFTAGISNNKPVTIVVNSPVGVRLDMFDKNSQFTHNGSHLVGGSYALNEGKWCVTELATKDAANSIIEAENVYVEYHQVFLQDNPELDGAKIILVNFEHMAVMSSDWNTTKDGSVYLCAKPLVRGHYAMNYGFMTLDRGAEITLSDAGDGTWTMKFGDTNNYLNDGKYLACTSFKNMDFKKKDDPAKGTRATISANDDGSVEISFGEAAGSIKYNHKNDGTSRFLNYDPADKPEDHLPVFICLEGDSGECGITGIESASDNAPVFYNLQGVRVTNPTPGLYIKHTGTKSVKVLIR